MRNDGVLDTLTSLLDADPDVADRDQIGEMIRHNAQLRGWVDAADVRLTRRLKQLEAEGKSENAGMAFTDEGRRSGKEAKATENREEICSEFPALEDALATGAASADHLDVLARLTRNLADRARQARGGARLERAAGPCPCRSGSGQARRQSRPRGRAVLWHHSGAGEEAGRCGNPRGGSAGLGIRAARADRGSGRALDGIPTSKMLEGEREKLLKMEEELGKRVIGQRKALTAVANAVRRARAGLNDEKRPLGSFLFLGPTGVGKTELTKAVAEYLFDDDAAMVRIDMSEFMEKHSVSRLIGAPPGYVGYDEGGVLTEAVRRRPYQVVLFDEVEKAHPDVFNVLLQVLDDGVLTDGQGRTVDFKQTLIILTSNLGARALSALPEGADPTEARAEVMEAVRTHFRPEFLNRLDEQVIFDRLDRSDMGAIVDIQLHLLEARLASRKVTLDLDEAAKQWLGDEGYDPVFGARPLKRVIQNHLQNPLAEMILGGEILDGSTVKVSAGAGGLIIGSRVSASRRPDAKGVPLH